LTDNNIIKFPRKSDAEDYCGKHQDELVQIILTKLDEVKPRFTDHERTFGLCLVLAWLLDDIAISRAEKKGSEWRNVNDTNYRRYAHETLDDALDLWFYG